MTKLFLTLLSLYLYLGMNAQTSVELNIQHKFEKSTFSSGQIYMDDNNRVVQIFRVQYYLSNLEIIHDGGQSTLLPGQHILIDEKKGNYDLGTTMVNIEAIEDFNFNLGVDASDNQNTPASYMNGQPLATQTPSMYAPNQNSYIFLAIEGLVDSDNDNVPDLPFSLQATGDQLLQEVSVEVQRNANNGVLQIELNTNIANWLDGISLDSVGTQINDGTINELMMDNTTDMGVFSSPAATSVQTLVSPKNQIHIDSRISYAPTIYYKFYTGEQVDMTITNVTGTYFIQRSELSPEGDFYMNDNLVSGIYIVIFTSPKGIRQCKRFTISR